jgi:cyclopropane-fatty-acyl-phospholipid synthase
MALIGQVTETSATETSASERRASASRGVRPHVALRLIDKALPALPKGNLRLTLPDGDTIERHGDTPGADATMIVHRWRGLWRMMLGGEDGFTEGYLDGDWSTPDLPQVLAFWADNNADLSDAAGSSWLGTARNRLSHLLRRNSKRGSRRNIAAHYDLGNEFFSAWLDPSMNYSSAVYPNAETTLEQAQQHKLDRIAGLLGLTGGERVLEIGCGWGALAERLIRGCGASVTGITLSVEQLAFAKTRLAHAAEHADLRLQDYRDVNGLFDRIVSIEMIEAVGARYWPAYFGKLRSCLVSGGSALLQAITIDEKRYADYAGKPDFIQRYIFPGGMLPTRAIIAEEAARAGLTLVHHESFGKSYVRTLREWRGRFLDAWPKLEPLGFNARFRRMWEYYLAYCEVGFDLGAIDVGFYKLSG